MWIGKVTRGEAAVREGPGCSSEAWILLIPQLRRAVASTAVPQSVSVMSPFLVMSRKNILASFYSDWSEEKSWSCVFTTHISCGFSKGSLVRREGTHKLTGEVRGQDSAPNFSKVWPQSRRASPAWDRCGWACGSFPFASGEPEPTSAFKAHGLPPSSISFRPMAGTLSSTLLNI